jgi:molybdopterin converting factor small subunit
MRVVVLYFGVLKDVVGQSRVVMELEEGSSVAELLALHRGVVAVGGSVWDSIAVAVNQEYARVGDLLKDGDEVALLPPVSGGFEGLGEVAGTGEHTPGAKAPNSVGG